MEGVFSVGYDWRMGDPNAPKPPVGDWVKVRAPGSARYGDDWFTARYDGTTWEDEHAAQIPVEVKWWRRLMPGEELPRFNTQEEISVVRGIAAGLPCLRITDGHGQIEYTINRVKVDPGVVESLADRGLVEWDPAGEGNKRTTEVRLTSKGRAEAERLR